MFTFSKFPQTDKENTDPTVTKSPFMKEKLQQEGNVKIVQHTNTQRNATLIFIKLFF